MIRNSPNLMFLIDLFNSSKVSGKLYSLQQGFQTIAYALCCTYIYQSGLLINVCSHMGVRHCAIPIADFLYYNDNVLFKKWTMYRLVGYESVQVVFGNYFIKNARTCVGYMTVHF